MSEERRGMPAIVTWTSDLVSEVARLPDTLRTLRLAVDDLGRTLSVVRRTADQLVEAVDPLTGAVDRVANIDRAVAELHAVFFAFLDRVPGGRRALKGVPFLDRDPQADEADVTLRPDESPEGGA